MNRDEMAAVGYRFRWLCLWRWTQVPDPGGLVGFLLVMGALLSHLAVEPEGRFLLSENRFLETAFQFWLLLAPPLGLMLGVRRLLVHGQSLVPLISVPLAAFLTLLTAAALGASFLS